MSDVDGLLLHDDPSHTRVRMLSEAALRINESLDVEALLQEVIDCARLLTGARYGALVIPGGIVGEQRPRSVITSGVARSDYERVRQAPGARDLIDFLDGISEPLRLGDLSAYTDAASFLEDTLPMTTFLGAPIRHLGVRTGSIFVSEKGGGDAFTYDDEETLVLFASQAAQAIANARRHRDEQIARADLEALIETSPIAVLRFDAQSMSYTSVNREARRLVQWVPPPGFNARQIHDALGFHRIDGSRIPGPELPLERALRKGETVYADEVVLHFPDGQRIQTLINATPIHGEDGEVASVMITLQDMRPRHELERLRSEFLGIVSHELRAPLTTIKGATATLLHTSYGMTETEVAELHRIIDRETDRLRDLVNNLLDMTRVETGTLSVTTAPVDVSALIDEASAAFTRSGARNDLEIDLAPDLPMMSADRVRILQVLNTLLANAASYSPDVSPISLAASQQDLYIAISVTDQGRGVSPEDLPHLFEKFRDEDGEDHTPISRVGLGLAICKGIVAAHGGRIHAESEGLGRGTRFVFTIPTADAPAPRETPAPAQPPERPATPAGAAAAARILAVDDDPQTLRYVRDTLADAGFRPTVTGNPGDVDRLVEEEAPDLILLALMLPGTSGLELMTRISGYSDAPVIFLSGEDRDMDVARTLELGADDYIVKPFSANELVARINASLRRRTASAVPAPAPPYRLHDLAIDYAARTVTVQDAPVSLTVTEQDLLFELAANAGRVLTYAQLLEQVWGPAYSGDTRLVRAFVRNLRNKLGDDAGNPRYILTHRGVGYAMPRP